MGGVRFAVVCWLTTFAAATCWGQPFSTLDVGGGVTMNVYAADLEPWWSAGLGGDLGARMPFYEGVLEAGTSLHYYTAADGDVPAFGSVYAFAGWGVRAALVADVQLYAGGRIGIDIMVFDEASDVRNRSRYESEMAVSPVLAVQRRLGGPWSMYAVVQQLIVLSAVRLHLTYLTVGLRRSLTAPQWLRSILE